MRRYRLRKAAMRLVVVFAVAGLAACVPNLHRPEVRLVNLQLAGLGLSGGHLRVRLGIYNPNTFALDASSLSYNVDLAQDSSDKGWLSLARGTYDQAIRVGPGDSTQVEIPVAFRYRGLGGAFRALLERGTFDYRIHGKVVLQEPIRREIPYRHRGAVSMEGAR